MSNRIFTQPSVMSAQQHFSQVPSADIPRSKFDRSHAYKTTFDAGLLCPVFVDEVLPGDTFHLSTTAFARLATPLKPIMDNIYLDTHFFFVPYRLVWQDWQCFCGERRNPDDDPSDYSVPQTEIDLTALDGTTLADYFGLPLSPSASAPDSVSALPFRAYALIWNEWYRDQNLQDRISVPMGTGPDTWDGVAPSRRGKRHDYFTSCLPWPQKGDPVIIPLGSTADVYSTNNIGVIGTSVTQLWSGGENTELLKMGGASSTAPAPGTLTSTNILGSNPGLDGAAIRALITTADVDNAGFYADLSSSTAISINDLRSAFQIQRLLERDARGGTRYIELVLSHFGVRSDDARLQRPEFIGRDIQNMVIGEVLATAQSSDDAATAEVPVGNMAGHGVSVGGRDGIYYRAEEHGFIIGIMSAVPDTAYQDGIQKHFFKADRLDYAFPDFAHLGEQPVLLKELKSELDAGEDPDAVFGYMPRYSEYRYCPSRVAGDFRDNLAYWTLGRIFDDPANPPALNAEFVECTPRLDIFAVTDPTIDHVVAQIINKVTVNRKLPRYGVPSTL